MISGKDNKNNKADSNNYLETKNKKWFRPSGENIDDHSNYREEHKMYYYQLRIPTHFSNIM